MKRLNVRAFAASVLMLAATVQASAATATPKWGGTLVIGMSGDIASTEFATKHDDNTAAVLHHVVEGLVAYRDDMTIGPMLAEKFEISADGKTYTFTLRPGLRFHNGAKLTSADVKWAWDRFRDPQRDWGDHCREWYDGSAEVYMRPSTITAVSAPDESTIVFRLSSPNALFLHLMASNHCITGIIHKDSLKPDGSWNRPVGTGPYMFKEWKKGEYVELARFANYQARQEDRTGLTGTKIAYLDTLRFVPFQGLDAAKDALVAGKVGAIIEAPYGSYQELASNEKLRVYKQERPAWEQLILQTRFDPLLRDVRIRQAIAYAIDRDRVIRETMSGFAKANPSAVARVLPEHTPFHDTSFSYNPDKARALLKEAGYTGQPIRIQASKSPYPMFYTAAVSVNAMLREAGINASVDEVDWPTQDKNYSENKYQLTSFAFSLRTDPALMYSAIVGQKADHKWYLWEDLEADSWVAQSAITSESADRQKLFDSLHKKMIDEVPTIGLYNNVMFTATDLHLKGFATWPIGLPRFWGVWREE